MLSGSIDGENNFYTGAQHIEIKGDTGSVMIFWLCIERLIHTHINLPLAFALSFPEQLHAKSLDNLSKMQFLFWTWSNMNCC